MSEPDIGGGMRRALARGGAILGARLLFSIGLSVTIMLLLMRMLGPTEYGSYVSALAIYQFTMGLADLGIETYLIRKGTEARLEDFDCVASFMLCLGCSVAVLLWFVPAVLPEIWAVGQIGGSLTLLHVLALAVPFQFLAVPATARLIITMDFRSVVAVQLVAQIIYSVIALQLTRDNWGAEGLAIAVVTQQFMNCLGVHTVNHRYPRWQWNHTTIFDMLSYGIGYSSSGWVWNLRNLVNPLIVGGFYGVEAVGIVNLADRLADLLSSVRRLSWTLVNAGLTRIKSDRSRVAAAIGEAAEFHVLAVGIPLLLFGLLSHEIVNHLLGARWLPALVVYPYVAMAAFTWAVFAAHGWALQILRRNWVVTFSVTVYVALFAGTAYLLVPPLGIRGYGYAEMAALIACAIIVLQVPRRVRYVFVLPLYFAISAALLLQPTGIWVFLLPLCVILWPSQAKHLFAQVRLMSKAMVG